MYADGRQAVRVQYRADRKWWQLFSRWQYATMRVGDDLDCRATRNFGTAHRAKEWIDTDIRRTELLRLEQTVVSQRYETYP